jgi:hypothetical protein
MKDANAGERTILIADDDRGLLRLIDKALRREGFATAGVASGKAVLEWLARQQPALLLLDLKLEDLEGKELIRQLQEKGHCPPFIIITGQGDERVAVEMMKRGARDYLVKDVDFLQFVPAVVKRALDQLEKERRLAEAEEQVRLVRGVVEQGFSAVLIADNSLPDPRILYINPAFALATGYKFQDVVGRPLSTLANLTSIQERLRRGLPGGEACLEEISAYQTAAGERWGEWRLGPVRDPAGRLTHWLIIFRDITERRRLEKEILEISDQQQQRLGQDLHDGLCQHLAGIELMSQVLEQKLARGPKAAAARAAEIARHVRDAISQTRALARGLSPLALDSRGLISALDELAARVEKMFHVACRFEHSPAVRVRDPAKATHLYRIAQEAVSNAIKHGKATSIRLELIAGPKRAILRVKDNGTGFSADPSAHGAGMGLRIMRYRAGIIGGSLQLEAVPAGGVSVVCSVPLESGSGYAQS